MKQYLLRFGVALIVLVAKGTVLAAEMPVAVELSVSETHVKVGQEVSVKLILKKGGEGESTVSLSHMTIPGLESFAHISLSQETAVQKVNNVLMAQSQIIKTVIPLKEGVFSLGPVRVPLKEKEGEAQFIESNTVQLTVKGVMETQKQSGSNLSMGDTTGLGIDAVEEVSVELISDKNWQFWGQIIGIVFLGWVFVFIMNKRKQKQTRGQLKITTEPVGDDQFLLLMPNGNESDFFERIQKVYELWGSQLWDLTPGEITRKNIVENAQKTFPEDFSVEFIALWDQYEFARFGGGNIEKRILRDRIELLYRKTKNIF